MLMKRNIVKIISEICAEEEIDLTSYSDNWILRLTKNNTSKYIFAYRFEINKASVDYICNNKIVLSSILKDFGLSVVEHYCLGEFKDLMRKDDNPLSPLNLLKKYQKLVLKPNEGSTGLDIYQVTNQEELEEAAKKIISKHSSVAICAFEDIIDEYRVVILDGKARLIYQKKLPCIIGNGKNNILNLIDHNQYELKDLNLDLFYVPYEGEKITLAWIHNLSNGAIPVIIEDQKIIDELTKEALKAVKALNLEFASIDIIKTVAGYKILEINSGVMIEHFSLMNKQNYQLTKEIYQDAIALMFK